MTAYEATKVFGMLVIVAIAGVSGMAIGYSVHPDCPECPSFAPTITTAPTIIPSPEYPRVVTFTVKYSTLSNGRYEVVDDRGQSYYLQTYDQWDAMEPGSVWAGAIEGQSGFIIILGDDLHLISRSTHYALEPTYPEYYYYDGEYWQWDGHVLDPVSYQQIRGHKYFAAKPPRYDDVGSHIVDTGGVVLIRH